MEKRWLRAIPALVFLFSGSAMADPQPPWALHAPPPAPPRKLDWNATFPYTPNFSEWSSMPGGRPDGSVTATIFLYRGSLKLRQVPGLTPLTEVDYIIRFDPGPGEAGGYYRFLFAYSCDFTRTIIPVANTRVAISPEGQITPVGDVLETIGYGVVPVDSRSLFDKFCFDADLRARFMQN